MAAIEQRKSYRCLELLDALRDGGLGGVQLRCGALECAELRDPVESFQLLKSDHPALYVFQGNTSLGARSGSHSKKRWFRWEASRVGKECVSTCRSRGSTYHSKKNTKKQKI